MIEKLRFYIWRIKEQYYRSHHILRVVETSTGIKVYNPVPFRSPFKLEKSDSIFSVPPEELHLGPDFLQDKFTLLGVSIQDSPHSVFIKGLLEGKDMKYSDYMNRLVDGRLDGRSITMRPRSMTYYETKCKERLSEIKAGVYEPVQIYNLGGQYYIRDGKHRAAMCSILGIPVRCVLVNATFTGGLTYHIINMIKGKASYEKNMSFFRTNGIFS